MENWADKTQFRELAQKNSSKRTSVPRLKTRAKVEKEKSPIGFQPQWIPFVQECDATEPQPVPIDIGIPKPINQ